MRTPQIIRVLAQAVAGLLLTACVSKGPRPSVGTVVSHEEVDVDAVEMLEPRNFDYAEALAHYSRGLSSELKGEDEEV